MGANTHSDPDVETVRHGLNDLDCAASPHTLAALSRLAQRIEELERERDEALLTEAKKARA